MVTSVQPLTWLVAPSGIYPIVLYWWETGLGSKQREISPVLYKIEPCCLSALTVPSCAGFDLGRWSDVMMYKTISRTASDGRNWVALSQFSNFLGTLLTDSSNMETLWTGKMLNSLSQVWNDLLGAVRTFPSAPDLCYLGLILIYFKAWSENYLTNVWKALRDSLVKTKKERQILLFSPPKY